MTTPAFQIIRQPDSHHGHVYAVVDGAGEHQGRFVRRADARRHINTLTRNRPPASVLRSADWERYAPGSYRHRTHPDVVVRRYCGCSQPGCEYRWIAYAEVLDSDSQIRYCAYRPEAVLFANTLIQQMETTK